MDVLQRADRSVAAFRLLAAVDSYSEAFDGLLKCWSSSAYAELGDLYHRVRTRAAAVPAAAVVFASLVIGHAELLSELWSKHRGRVAAKLNAARQRHSDAVAQLRRTCLQLLCRA